MKVHHLHLKTCPSTQKYLQEFVHNSKSQAPHTIVSTAHQTDGTGRRGNQWLHFDNAIAFSFTINPLEPLTLTPLEIGLYITQYIKNKFGKKILLKWPNDLLNEQYEKCGGIICSLNDEALIVGVGLNLGQLPKHLPPNNHHFPIGTVDENHLLEHKDKKDIPAQIYDFILNARSLKHGSKIPELWLEQCAHKNRLVTIDNQKGRFIGIGKKGEAILELPDKTCLPIFSGSLLFL